MLHVTWLVFPTFLDGLKKMNLLIPVFHIALYLLKYLSNVRLLIKIYARRRAIERRWRSLRHPRSPATSSTPRPADIKTATERRGKISSTRCFASAADEKVWEALTDTRGVRGDVRGD